MNSPEVGQQSSMGFIPAAGAVAAALVIGVVVGHYLWPQRPLGVDQPAKYVLNFGDANNTMRVTVNEAAFEAALSSPTPNWSTLKKRPTETAAEVTVPIPTPVPAPAGTTLITRINVTQQRDKNAPCTLHVTQKVGLNNPGQVERVLAALVPE